MTVTAEREKALLESVPTGLLIDGEWRDASSGKTFDVKDPATGKVIASLQDANSDDAMAAFDAACAAQADWARTPAKERADILRFGFYVVDLAVLPALRRARDEFLGDGPRPSSSAVQVAGLVLPGALLEIDLLAVTG